MKKELYHIVYKEKKEDFYSKGMTIEASSFSESEKKFFSVATGYILVIYVLNEGLYTPAVLKKETLQNEN